MAPLQSEPRLSERMVESIRFLTQPNGCIFRPWRATFATRRLHINMADENRIEKKILLRAPRSRVWRAISNAAEFGEWFRAKFEGGFAEGTVARGHITYPGYEHV